MGGKLKTPARRGVRPVREWSVDFRPRLCPVCRCTEDRTAGLYFDLGIVAAVSMRLLLFLRSVLLLFAFASLPCHGADPPAAGRELASADQAQAGRAAQPAEAPLSAETSTPAATSTPAGTSTSKGTVAGAQDGLSSGDGAQAAGPGGGADRKALNLLGSVDASSGESRRNENVRITLVDNAVQRELNERLGASATIVQEFNVDSDYFGGEFGGSPSSTLHLKPKSPRPFHGNIYEMHNNSVVSARSFFQVGSVKPSRANNYGFVFSVPIGRGVNLSVDGNQNKVRGNVNGNVLVPKADERTPLDRDPLTGEPVDQGLHQPHDGGVSE